MQYFSVAEFEKAGITAGPQVTQVARDAQGRLVLANTGGVLVADGTTFSVVPGTESFLNAKMATTPDGTLFLGSRDDLGFLETDSLGQVSFQSLRAFLPDTLPRFRIYQVVAHQAQIFFLSPQFIAVWNGKKMQHLPTRGSNYRLMPAGEALFLQDRKAGLLRWQTNAFEPVPGGEATAGIMPKAMIRLSGAPGCLLVSRRAGLFHFANGVLTAFPTEADHLLKSGDCYTAMALPRREIAIATYGNGLLVLDQEGRLLHQWDEAAGLPDQQVIHVSQDAQGSMWLGLNQGYARIGYPNPVSHFDQRLGLRGIVLAIHAWQNYLYVGTTTGLYRMKIQPGNSKTGRFEQVEAIRITVHDIEVLQDDPAGLLVATGEGLFVGDGIHFTKLSEEISREILFSDVQPGRAYVGVRHGVQQLQLTPKLELLEKVDLPYCTPWEMVELSDGSLLAAEDSLVHVTWKNGAAQVRTIDSTFGWTSEMGAAILTRAGEQPLIGNEQGCYHFDQERGGVEPVRAYGEQLANGPIQLLRQIGEDSLFLVKRRAAGIMRQVKGQWEWDTLRFRDFPALGVWDLHRQGEILWIGTSAGLYRLDMEADIARKQPFQLVLRQALAAEDSILALDGRTFALSAELNQLSFSLTATEFSHPEAIRFRYRLQGAEEEWSRWTTRNYVQYARLAGGDYVFEAQARNYYGELAETQAFRVHVATPWYLQRWMYLVYALLGGGLLYGAVQLRTRHLRRAKVRLEGIVAERTREVEAQKAQILAEKQETERQKDRAEESERVKKRFFANMTHELRTPLTLILGPMAQLKAHTQHAEGQEQLGLIERNGKRLLRLINQLLDISRIESDRMELHPARVDLVAFARQALNSFRSAAEGKGLELEFFSAEEELAVDLDAAKMEKVVFNLLSNAVKFTQKGKIVLKVARSQSEGRTWTKISVEDTGKGIAASAQAHVFDRFYQSENVDARQGSGIGMALSKELVELHGGQIGLESEEGKGSTFWLMLPCEQNPEVVEAGDPVGGESVELYLVDAPHVPVREGQISEAQALGEDAKNLVLVVEDNADVRAYIVSCIPPEFRVMEAGDGEEGLEMAQKWVPDLVISDVMMPRRDGYELAAQLKEQPATSHIPLILLTSRAEAESRLQGLEKGADAYLTKPFDPAELQIRIRKLIALRATLREKYRGEVLLQTEKVAATSTEETFLLKVKTLIQERLGDETLQVEDMAAVVHLSKVQFSRKFKALTGTTPNKYLRRYRLEVARQLIEQQAGSMAEIGFQVGFSSAAYFSKCFMDAFGMSPSSLARDSGKEA